MEQNQTGQKCNCPHHKVVPALIVLLGLLFLLDALEVLVTPEITAIVWPVIVILIGLQKFFGGKCKCC